MLDQDRSTPRPPFDPEIFARESESRLRAAEQQSSTPAPRSLQRPKVPPLQWGRTGDAPPRGPELQESPWTFNALDAVGPDTVPVVMLSSEKLARIAISSEASLLLNQIDGVRPLHVVCAMANMTPDDGATILLALADQGVISFL